MYPLTSPYQAVRRKHEPINTEGLRRRGFSDASLSDLRRAFKLIYRQGLTLDIAMERLEEMAADRPEITPLLESLKLSERGIVR
jgi:UDP-N-acetylglucosamine acyltransferase